LDTATLIVAIATVLVSAQLIGWIFVRIGQPHVVGEMIAGILLGPSLFGHFFPATFAGIFSASSIAALDTLSQFGMLLFMFLVGVEVDAGSILRHKAVVVFTSNLSILLPLVLGATLAGLLYPAFAGQHVRFYLFALFVGTAMSVTAFPVLAGILRERGLLTTELGAVAISCAAIDDASAWLLLAVLNALVHSSQSGRQFLVIVLFLMVFVAVMLIPVRAMVAFVERRFQSADSRMGLFSMRLLIMLAASWVTQRLGIHALFGAFVAGLAMYKDKRVIEETASKIEPLAVVLLLPVFFALTGLKTRMDLLGEGGGWYYAVFIIGVATIGKLGGASLASRATGLRWKDAIGLGILMNTRGLVELVILNAGLELGIISPSLFSIMVLVAIVTTFLTTPALSAIAKISEPQVQMAGLP